MDKITNKIFKYIYKNPKNVSISKLAQHFKIDNYLIYESNDYLIKEDLIINFNGSIRLTPKGKDFYNSKHRKVISSICKYAITGIIIPIIVSWITSLLVNNYRSNNTNNNRCNNCQEIQQ